MYVCMYALVLLSFEIIIFLYGSGSIIIYALYGVFVFFRCSSLLLLLLCVAFFFLVHVFPSLHNLEELLPRCCCCSCVTTVYSSQYYAVSVAVS